MARRTKLYYEDLLLGTVDEKGVLHPPKNRHGSVSSSRCADCELRGAVSILGLPLFCSECRMDRKKMKRRCNSEKCANGCEVCGGTGRV